MTTQTEVELYQCYQCGRQRFMFEIRTGKYCRCGSLHIKRLAPTIGSVIWFFFRNPGMLKTFFEENLLGKRA